MDSDKKNHDSVTIYIPKRHSGFAIECLYQLGIQKFGHTSSLSRTVRQMIYDTLIQHNLMDRQGKHLMENLAELKQKNKDSTESEIF